MPSFSAWQSEIDLAVAAYRDGGQWQAQDLPLRAVESLDSVAQYLRQFPGDVSLALLSVEEEFFIVLRPTAMGQRVLLSDASAAADFELARSVVDHLGMPVGDEDEVTPVGDLGLLSDLGMTAVEMGLLLDEDDLYPDEQLSDVATRLGFGPQFDDLAGLTTA